MDHKRKSTAEASMPSKKLKLSVAPPDVQKIGYRLLEYLNRATDKTYVSLWALSRDSDTTCRIDSDAAAMGSQAHSSSYHPATNCQTTTNRSSSR